MRITTVLRHLRIRLAIGAVLLATLPLYTIEETVSRARRRPYYLPGRAVDRLDDRFITLERKAIIAGDIRYTCTAKKWADKACDGIDTVLTRLTRRS